LALSINFCPTNQAIG